MRRWRAGGTVTLPASAEVFNEAVTLAVQMINEQVFGRHERQYGENPTHVGPCWRVLDEQPVPLSELLADFNDMVKSEFCGRQISIMTDNLSSTRKPTHNTIRMTKTLGLRALLDTDQHRPG